MTRKIFIATLAGVSSLAFAVPATAQETAPEAAQPEPTEPDASDSTADAAIAAAQPVDEMQAKIELLSAQVEALQEALEAVKATQAKTVPSWKGAPQLEDKEAGWSFKPRGRLMYDIGYVQSPDGYSNKGLGISNEVRRARLGVEGTVPGGFGYKFELDFAAGDVEFADAFLNYKTGPWEFTFGQHNNFQSLDELTSSLHSSFIERAAFTDAFGFERRVGVWRDAGCERSAPLRPCGLIRDRFPGQRRQGDHCRPDQRERKDPARHAPIIRPVLRGR